MSLDTNKVRDTFERLDAAKKRFDFEGLGDTSAVLGAAGRFGSGLDRIDAFGAGGGLAAAGGAGLGSLASDALGAGLGDTKGLGRAGAKLGVMGGRLSALTGLPDGGLPSAMRGIAEPPSWVEKPFRVGPPYGPTGAAGKVPKFGVLDGLKGVDKWRGFGVSTSLTGIRGDPLDLDSARGGIDIAGDIARGLSGPGKPGTLGDLGLGGTGAASVYGAGGLAGAGDSGVFGSVFEPFQGVAEIARKTFGWMDGLRPYLDQWAQIAKEAMRAARRIAAEPARTGDYLLALEAHEALEAMQRGRHKVAVRFLEKRLNLRATIERLEALYLYLKKSFERPVSSLPLWVTLEGGKARAYLAIAVFRIAGRIKLRRRMEDDIWGSVRGQDGEKEPVRPGSARLVFISDQATDDFADSSLDPAKLVALGINERNRILDELAETGTPADREIIYLIRSGYYDRADVRNIVGSPGSKLSSARSGERRRILRTSLGVARNACRGRL